MYFVTTYDHVDFVPRSIHSNAKLRARTHRFYIVHRTRLCLTRRHAVRIHTTDIKMYPSTNAPPTTRPHNCSQHLTFSLFTQNSR